MNWLPNEVMNIYLEEFDNMMKRKSGSEETKKVRHEKEGYVRRIGSIKKSVDTYDYKHDGILGLDITESYGMLTIEIEID